MNEDEQRVYALGETQHNVVTTAQALRCGMTKSAVNRRDRSGPWTPLFRGAHVLGPGNPTWLQRAHAAVLLAGDGAALSHRAGGTLYELDACQRGPFELTVLYPRQVRIAGVLAHRSRILTAAEVRTWNGVPVTRIERTIVELAVYLPPLAVEKAMESAFRRGLTNAPAVERYIADLGRLLPGASRVSAVLLERGASAGVAGSPAEVELIACLRERGVEAPIRQYEIDLGGGWKVKVDLCWPWRRAIVEYYGVDVHAGAAAVAYDLERENALNDAGYDLRRYGGGLVRRDPDAVANQIVRLLERHPIVGPRTAA